MALFQAGKKAEEIDKSNLPRHIAIIMDGNGRWAKKRGLPRTAGHAAGAETFRSIATYCKNLGVQYLTVYAFSTENWRRPQEEVDAIMGLLEKYLGEAIEKMERDDIRLHFFGDLSVLSPRFLEKISRTDVSDQRLPELRRQGRDRPCRAALCPKRCRRRGERARRSGLFRPAGLLRHSGPGPAHPPRRGAAAQQLPALAVRLFRARVHGHALARLHPRGD